MGIPLSCQYCSNARQVRHYVTVEILNPGPLGWFEPPLNDCLRTYQKVFSILFESLSPSSVGAGLCPVCFSRRFVGNRWKDYRQKFEVGDKICLLTIDYKERGYFQGRPAAADSY